MQTLVNRAAYVLSVATSVLLLCCLSLAQAELQKTADDLFRDSKWEQAAQAYSQITAKDPGNGQAWQNLGECYVQTGKFNEAAQAFDRAVQLKVAPLMNRINTARAYVAMGYTAKGLGVLKEVSANPRAGGLRNYVLSATEFQKLQSNAEFGQVIKALAPCQTEEYRQFDFWVGDWEVQNPQGKPVGQNLVTNEQSGCLIIEHWKSGRGVETGTSFNYYDIHDKKWHQLYISNAGDAEAFPPMAGELKDGKMVLITDETKSPVFRWAWYVLSPGHVRQMAEQSDDGQKTWRIVWDSVYVAKPEQK